MNKWVNIFRALANINRLKIIDMLERRPNMNVGDIAGNLHISLKATSNHLAILKSFDVVEGKGSAGHVFYSMNSQMPKDFQRAINLFL